VAYGFQRRRRSCGYGGSGLRKHELNSRPNIWERLENEDDAREGKEEEEE
jgi:hypothetical protein